MTVLVRREQRTNLPLGRGQDALGRASGEAEETWMFRSSVRSAHLKQNQ